MSFFSQFLVGAQAFLFNGLTRILAIAPSKNPQEQLGAAGSHGRTVAYIGKTLMSFTLVADSQRLHLGQAHSLLLEIDTVAEGGLPANISIEHAPAKAPILQMEATPRTLRAWLVRIAFGLHTKRLGVLDVRRDIRVRFSDGQFFLAPPDVTTEPGDWPEKYTRSVAEHLVHVVELAARRQTLDQFSFAEPLISFIVPVFNAKPHHLDDLLRSFQQQPRSVAELILSDDNSSSPQTIDWLDRHAAEPNVTIVRNRVQSGIAGATQAGLNVARGTWVSFIDHDDALVPFCVGEIARAIYENPDCQFLYTDEVITDENLVPDAYFLKPAWDPVLLSGVNYINHLSIYKRDAVLDCGGLRSDFDGSQDYDLLLRYTARLHRKQVRHLPFPAYLWRRSSTTYSVQFLEKATRNARSALVQRFGNGQAIEVEGAIDPNLHRVRFDKIRTTWPKVSIVIPSRDSADLILVLLQGLFEQTDYPNFEIIVIDNGTTQPETLEIYQKYSQRPNFRVVIEPMNFNFSASVNKGLNLAEGDLILLLNNDIEVIEANWLKEMVACFDYEDVGIVGAKLLYPNGKLQHAGVIAGLGQLAGHWYIEEEANFPGPMGRLWVRQTLSCVTGAVMLLSRRCANAVGLFDEANFAIAYNDVDFCLRATNAGFRVVWTPFAVLIHHESASRGSDESADKIERFRREQANLRRIHATHLLEDPAFSPWYSRMYSHPTYLWRRDLPESR